MEFQKNSETQPHIMKGLSFMLKYTKSKKRFASKTEDVKATQDDASGVSS